MLREMRGNKGRDHRRIIIRIQVLLNPVKELELPNEKDDLRPLRRATLMPMDLELE
jgi:hypothetical protein